MAEWFKDWLFTGVAASTVLMSICAYKPGHPLAILARNAGLALAVLCILAVATASYLRWRRGPQQTRD